MDAGRESGRGTTLRDLRNREVESRRNAQVSRDASFAVKQNSSRSKLARFPSDSSGPLKRTRSSSLGEIPSQSSSHSKSLSQDLLFPIDSDSDSQKTTLASLCGSQLSSCSLVAESKTLLRAPTASDSESQEVKAASLSCSVALESKDLVPEDAAPGTLVTVALEPHITRCMAGRIRKSTRTDHEVVFVVNIPKDHPSLRLRNPKKGAMPRPQSQVPFNRTQCTCGARLNLGNPDCSRMCKENRCPCKGFCHALCKCSPRTDG